LDPKAKSASVKRILWSRRAPEQLAAGYDFIVEDNPSAAEKQVEMILRAVEQLVDFPEMGRPGRINGTRELVIPELLILWPTV
jgi:toxin ParE1/3/4